MLLRMMTIGLVASVCLVSRAEAAMISIVPGSQNATIGTPVSVDIVVTDLAADESVGGVALRLLFSNVLLDGIGFTLDPDERMGVPGDPDFEIFDFASGFTGGSDSPFEAVFLAGFLLDHAALKAMQGDSFRLATLTFNPLLDGLAFLTIVGIPNFSILSDAAGDALIGTQVNNGEICIGGNCDLQPIPEPATLTLLGLGVGTLIARRRQARRRA